MAIGQQLTAVSEKVAEKKQNALKARPQDNMGFFTTPRPHGEEPRVTWIKEVLGCEDNEVLAFIRNCRALCKKIFR